MSNPDLLTPWGESLDPAAVLPDYPRPGLVRDSYLNLNGRWDYAVTRFGADRPETWTGQILVPFSPEAPLSGVGWAHTGRVLQPDEELWYRREFVLPAGFRRDRILLHIGAVDQECEVWVDGQRVWGQAGGYLPCSFDITDRLTDRPDDQPEDRHEIVVRVRDETDTGWRSRGKQRLAPGGIWYTAQSGIWQTVWLESVPAIWVDELALTPHLESGEVEVSLVAAGASDEVVTALVELRADGVLVGAGSVTPGEPTRLAVTDVRPWSPEDPFLYDVHVRLEAGAGDRLSVDEVTSYTALRSVEVGPDPAGRLRLLLNGAPYLHAGLLDQGYWPDGLMTAPSDAALVHDITTAKELGFTMLRKHLKIEPARWYHHCDRLGMLVWQDLVNGGRTHRDLLFVKIPVVIPLPVDDADYEKSGRTDAESRAAYRAELEQTVKHLRNHPSIVCWVAFNEGWGQFDANAAAARIREIDPTRLIDHASGWHDQGGGDLASRHVYFRPFRLRRKDRRSGRAVVLSEYGGYSYRVPGHVWSEREYGYGTYSDADAFRRAFLKLQSRQLRRAIGQGLAGFCYTQLSDVEEETNGLLTYDRRVTKIDVGTVAGSNRLLQETFTSAIADRT